jgi:hypothetical protein
MSKGKYLKKHEPVVNVAITMALVLFWLVIISTYLTAGLFAKYSTKDEGNDEARVIQFKNLTVLENGVADSAGSEFIFIPGVSLEKDITVKFDGSEAATYVFVTLDAIGWDADANARNFVMNYNSKEIMSWSVDSAWKYLTTEALTPSGHRHVYYMEVDPNAAIAQKVIKDSQIAVSDQGYRVDYAAMTDAKVKLELNATAYVVQANGFEDAEAAWASLSTKEVAS